MNFHGTEPGALMKMEDSGVRSSTITGSPPRPKISSQVSLTPMSEKLHHHTDTIHLHLYTWISTPLVPTLNNVNTALYIATWT